jgi:hypothetical protein
LSQHPRALVLIKLGCLPPPRCLYRRQRIPPSRHIYRLRRAPRPRHTHRPKCAWGPRRGPSLRHVYRRQGLQRRPKTSGKEASNCIADQAMRPISFAECDRAGATLGLINSRQSGDGPCHLAAVSAHSRFRCRLSLATETKTASPVSSASPPEHRVPLTYTMRRSFSAAIANR